MEYVGKEVGVKGGYLYERIEWLDSYEKEWYKLGSCVRVFENSMI